MFCSLNSEAGQKAYLSLAKHISSVMNEIASLPGATFSLDALIKDMYQKVYASTNNHERAVDIARMIPQLVGAVAFNPVNAPILGTLISKGFDPALTAMYIVDATDDKTGVTFIENKVGTVKDLAQDIKDAQGTVNSTQSIIDEKSEEANKGKKLDPGTTVSGVIDVGVDPKTGVPEVVDVTDDVDPIANKKAEIERRARVADIITSQLELGVELPKILETLAEQGYVEKINGSAFFKQSVGRDAIVFNIDGAIIPVYRSSEGTSSKTKGEWYPFFFNGGDWLVKAGADTYKDGYNNPIIKQILDALNKNYKYDKPLAKVEGNNEELLALLPLGGLDLDVSFEDNSGIYDFQNYAAIAIILKDWQSKLGNIDVTGYQKYLDGVSSSLIKANPTLKSDIQLAFDEVSKLFAELAALEGKPVDLENQIKDLEKKKREELGKRHVEHDKDIKAGITTKLTDRIYKDDIEEITARYDAQINKLKEQLDTEGETVTPYKGKRFEALADTALKDTAQEAISDNPEDPNYNVKDTDPKRTIHFVVKRNILRLLTGKNSGSEINYPGAGKIYLRAQSKGTIPDDRLLSDKDPRSSRNTSDVVAVVVDAAGNPVKFDDAGNVSPNGNIVFFNINKPYNIEAEYERKRVAAIVKMSGVSEEEAIDRLLDEKKTVNGIIDHVMLSPSTNSVMLDITGGSLGYVASQEDKYTLSKVNLNNAPFTITKGKGNIYQITIPSISENPITLFNPEVRSNPKLMELFADLLVNDVFFPSGSPVTLAAKKKQLKNFLYFSLQFEANLDVKGGALILFGQETDLSTDEAKAAAKEKILKIFNSPFVSGTLSATQVNEKKAKGAKVYTDQNDPAIKQGDILETDGVYQLLNYPGLYIAPKIWDLKENETGTVPFINLTKDDKGRYVLSTIADGYISDYVFENFLIDKQLNGNNEIVLLNPYLTFTPLNYRSIAVKKEPVKDAVNEALGFEIKSYDKPWRDGSNINKAKSFALKNKPSEIFELVEDKENGYYSIHFKTTEKGSLTNAEKQKLIQVIASSIPVGSKVSTWGTVTKGGFSGLERFLQEGFVKTSETRDSGGNIIPVYEKVNKTNPSAAKDYENMSYAQKEAFKIAEYAENNKGPRQSTAKIAADIFLNNLKKGNYNARTKEEVQEILDELIKNAALKKTHITPIQKLIDTIAFSETEVEILPEITDEEYVPVPEEVIEQPVAEITLTDDEIAETDSLISGIEATGGEDQSTEEEEDDNDGYYKRQAQIDNSEKITAQQLKEAREWYERSPISKVFTFEEAYNLVNQRNPDSIAQWTRNGIVLFKGSNLTDLYHEAFHGFTQAFMTPAQRADLYNAVREKSGTFVTYKGQTKSFADATNKEAEEYLAEGFRKWMLAGAKKTSLDKSSSKIANFFEWLFNKLKALFGKYEISDITANDKANEFIEDIYNKLSDPKGDFGIYKFSVDNLNQGFDVLYKGPQAVNEELPINKKMPYLNNMQSDLLMSSIDSWMAQVLSVEATQLSEEKALKFFNDSIKAYVSGEKSASQIESERTKIAKELNYGKIARKLKSKQGRTNLYKQVYNILGKLYNEVYNKREELKRKTDRNQEEQNQLAALEEQAKILYWSYTNFGDINNLDANVQSEDGTFKGVIAYHIANSPAFGGAAIEGLDAIDQEETNSRSPYADRLGNEQSLVDLAKERAEVKFLFRSVFRINPETGTPYMNSLGAPEIMHFRDLWNKVALLLENTLDPAEMYAKLAKFAASEDKTEMTYAVAQLMNKLGPKGLDRSKHKHLQDIDAENLWTSFWSIFSNRRIALMAMTATITEDKGKISFESRIGRGINPNARVGKKWDSDFPKSTNKYKIVIDGIPQLDLKQIVKDFSSLKNKVQKSRKIDPQDALDFLSALGINLTANKEVINALQNGDPEFEVPADFNVLKTFFANRFSDLRTLDPTLGSLKNSEFPSYLEILANDPNIIIQRPSDLFKDRRNLSVKIGTEVYDMPELKGENKNWGTLQLVEGQFGSGIPSFMATTADNNTQFEHSLNSTMSVMVTDINNVEFYDDFLKLPHLRHLHYEFNPAAKNYAWLKNMYYLDKEKDGNNYGKRKIVNGVKVALVLNNISGVKVDERDGVASAKADQFTKFILDVHLMTQVGLPELMRHSDKSTSYSVTLNIMEPLGDEFTDWSKGALYMPTIAFLNDRSAYHNVLYNNFIIPNLNIELTRIIGLKNKEKEIIDTLKKIREQKKKGGKVDPTPVFDMKYLKQGQKFLSFQGILNKKTKEDLLAAFEKYTNDQLAAGVEPIKITLQDFLKTDPALDLKITQETSVYFHNTLFNQTKITYEDSGSVLADNLIDTVYKQALNKNKALYENTKGNRELWEDAILRSYTINAWIHNIESMNVLYGDPASYDHAKEDFHKRNAGLASTGNIYRVDDDMLYTINNTLGGRKFEDQYRLAMGLKPRRAYDGTMATAVIKDKITKSIYWDEIGYNLYVQDKEKALRANNRLSDALKRSEKEIDEAIKTKLFGKSHKNLKIKDISSLKNITPDRKSVMRNYFEMTEADAQGWISMDAYRALLYSQGEWTPGHQKLYDDMLAGKEIDQAKVGIFFPPIKAQYWGPLMTDAFRVDAFHKFQLTPMVPTLLQSTPKLKALSEKMMKEGIDYSVFQSGSKMGNMQTAKLDENDELVGEADNVYDNDTRDINEDVPFTVNTIFVKYLKNQLKIAPKFKGKNTFPTQIRKIIETGLMENGIPTDYKPNDEFESRVNSWNALKQSDKIKESTNYRKLINYENAIRKLSFVKRAQLFSKAKINFNPKTGEIRGNLQNIVEFIKTQLSKEDLADHELDFIKVDEATGQLQADLSYSLSSELIESVLNALITKSLVKQKVTGEPLIQVSGAMLEEEPQFTNPTEEQLKKYGGTNGLTFFRLEEGGQTIEAIKIKIAMQGDYEKLLYLDEVAVYKDEFVPDLSKIKIKAKEGAVPGKIVRVLDYDASLQNLNNLIKDEDWLNKGENRNLISAFGVRIPTQSENATVFAEVYQFLPKEAGNIIILPAEIVAQSGGDFDIDKLTLQFPNIKKQVTIDDNGVKSTKVGLYKETDDKELRAKYEKYKKAQAEYLLLGNQYKTESEKKRALELMQLLSKGDIIESTINDMIKEGEALTFEEFALTDLEKSAQNDVMYSMIDILRSPAAYINLVRPNSIDILEPLADDAKEKFKGYTPKISTNDEEVGKEIQVSRIYEPIYNLFKHYTNNSAKAGVGIGAIDITYNEIFNRVGMYMTPNNREFVKGLEFNSPEVQEAIALAKRQRTIENIDAKKKAKRKQYAADNLTTYDQVKPNLFKSKADKEQYFLTDAEEAEKKKVEEEINNYKSKYKLDPIRLLQEFQRQTIYLPHNTMKVKDSAGNFYNDLAISLSHTTDVFGQNQISDVLSQLENGWLDAAKEPWIYYLRGNEQLAPHLLFLVQAGVPIEHVVSFIGQPIVVEYMETLSKLQSQFGQLMQFEGVNNVTRNQAKLMAKKIMLEKLGYSLEGYKGKNNSEKLNKLLSEESFFIQPENGAFNLDQLKDQIDYVWKNYQPYEKNGKVRMSDRNIDYSDEKLNDLQKQILIHFLQVSEMQDSIRDVKMKTNFDTTPSKTLNSAQTKISQLKELKRTKTEKDGDISSQNKYWRVPSQIIEKIVPTIKRKDADGTLIDTGNLDDDAIESPIGSFYVQPIQNYLWSPLFPLKSNRTINNFIDSLGFIEKDKARNNTWMSDDEEVITGFKNALVPIIFQNEFLSFDVRKLMSIDLEPTPVTYRDAEVKLESVIALTAGGAVAKMDKGQMTIYFDYNTLYNQFINKDYAKENYGGDLRFQTLPENQFRTFGEYVKYVFEREYIRATFAELGGKKVIDDLFATDPKANSLYKDSLARAKAVEGIEKKDINKIRKRIAFETYITNKALVEVYNMRALFNGIDTAYAFEITKYQDDPAYSKLVKEFNIFQNLTADAETTKGGQNRINLAFVESVNDASTINSYYEQVAHLSNSAYLTRLNSIRNLGLSPSQIREIESTFKKLPIIAFLQSGMEPHGRFALNRIVDESVVRMMSQSWVDSFIEKVQKEELSKNSSIRYKTLHETFNAFVGANKRYDSRGKNYIIDRTKDGKPALSLEDLRIINSDINPKEALFDPAYIQSNGLPSNGFISLGDTVSTDIKFRGDKTYEGVVSNISYENGLIDITIDATSGGKVKLLFDTKGNIRTAYTSKAESPTDFQKTTFAKPKFELSKYFIKEVIGEDRVYTSVGDTVTGVYSYSIKEKSVLEPISVTVDSIKDIGYLYNQGKEAQGTNRYLVDVTITSREKPASKTFVIDTNGIILGEVFKGRFNLSDRQSSLSTIVLPADKRKADPSLVFRSMVEMQQAKAAGRIPAGEIVEVLSFSKDASGLPVSDLYVLDGNTGEVSPLTDNLYDDYLNMEEDIQELLEKKNRFVVYNDAVKGMDTIEQDSSPSTNPLGGKEKLKDRFVKYGDFNLKIGIPTRKKYSGGKLNEYFEDDYDYINNVQKPNAEAVEAIDKMIDSIKLMMDQGYTPIFNNSGYGQYMIGASDDTGRMIPDAVGTGQETFKYLSTRLLEIGFVNPNFVKEAEGVPAIIKATNQPATEEDIVELMKKCFLI